MFLWWEFLKLIDTFTPRLSSSVTLASQMEPTNMVGDVPGPGDDVFIYQIFSNQSLNCGDITLKRYAEKTRCRSRNTAVVSAPPPSYQGNPVLLSRSSRKLMGVSWGDTSRSQFYSWHNNSAFIHQFGVNALCECVAVLQSQEGENWGHCQRRDFLGSAE